MAEYTINEEVITLTSGKYSAVQYKYGKVELIPDFEKGELRLKFEYDVLNGVPLDKQEFEQEIGAVLHELIDNQRLDRTIVYTGGIDEEC